jgi:uncharacterized membrane protein required for colicin V production
MPKSIMKEQNMAGFDILALAVVGLATIFGLARGFFHQFLKACAVGGALAILYFFLPDIQNFISRLLRASAPTARYIAVLGTVFGIYIAVSIITCLLRKPIRKVGFGGLDRLIGGALGFARGAGLLAAFMFALVSFPDAKIREDFLKPNVFKNSWAAPRMVVGMGYIRPAFGHLFFIEAEETLAQ